MYYRFADIAQSSQEAAVHRRSVKLIPGHRAFQQFPQSPVMHIPPANDKIKVMSPILLMSINILRVCLVHGIPPGMTIPGCGTKKWHGPSYHASSVARDITGKPQDHKGHLFDTAIGHLRKVINAHFYRSRWFCYSRFAASFACKSSISACSVR